MVLAHPKSGVAGCSVRHAVLCGHAGQSQTHADEHTDPHRQALTEINCCRGGAWVWASSAALGSGRVSLQHSGLVFCMLRFVGAWAFARLLCGGALHQMNGFGLQVKCANLVCIDDSRQQWMRSAHQFQHSIPKMRCLVCAHHGGYTSRDKRTYGTAATSCCWSWPIQ